MRLNPYLFFAGQCEAAFKYYEKSLGGKSSMMMTYGESPMLEQDGKVQMALPKTFWSARFGKLVDRFGIRWMINCEQAS
ncbi:MAG TPA: hypothetical protein VK788_04035 [Terriglobales bacterium]|jgi:uncharacterized glyoxalase superfamily protein PhnB|nr:hypothetical protein [Terriglobales bacterium]